MSNLHELEHPPADAISSVQFSPTGARLAVGCWDSSVYIYERAEDESQPYTLANKVDTAVPVLDVEWLQDDNTIVSVGLDSSVRRIRLDNDEEDVLSVHEKASNKVAYSRSADLVLTTSWDKTLHVHDPQTKFFIRVQLPAKPFALSLTDERAVVAMAGRKVSVYDLAALRKIIEQTQNSADMQEVLEIEPWQQRESSLKFMTRAVACMPSGVGFATSSIEGRVGVEWFEPDKQKDAYAFKCHRQTQKTTDEEGDEVEIDVIYPVNTLAFHPVHHTFATGGGDGVVALWDATTKRRVRQYKDLGASVAAMDFSPDGKFMAVGISPGFEDAQESQEIDPTRVKLFIRVLGESETKGKVKADK